MPRTMLNSCHMQGQAELTVCVQQTTHQYQHLTHHKKVSQDTTDMHVTVHVVVQSTQLQYLLDRSQPADVSAASACSV